MQSSMVKKIGYLFIYIDRGKPNYKIRDIIQNIRVKYRHNKLMINTINKV